VASRWQLATALQSGFIVLALPGVAAIVADVTGMVRGADRTIVIRALVFVGVSVALAPGVWRPSTPASPSLERFSIARVAWLAIYLAALWPWLMAADDISLVRANAVWGVAVAASAEEVVFRVTLPNAILASEDVRRRDGPHVWLAYSAAQLSFALSHSAMAGGFRSWLDASELLRLLGAGCCFASIRLTQGVVVAAAAHTILNLALSSRVAVTPLGMAARTAFCVSALTLSAKFR